MPDKWLPGEVAHLTLAVTDVDGQPADPGMLRLMVMPPDEIVTTYQLGIGPIQRIAAGIFYADIALTASGVWAWRWESDAPHVGAAEGSLFVRASLIP